MGRTIRTQQKKNQGRKKVGLKFKAIFLALLVITLTLFSINKTDSPSKSPNPQPTKATMEQKKANKAVAKEFAWAGYGWKDKQWSCISKLFTAESRFDHFADNPKSTAYGIGQVLGEKSNIPEIQILRAYKYIKHRYTTPCKAWNFHLKRNYY